MPLFHAVTTVQGADAAAALALALEGMDPPPAVTGAHDRDDATGLWEVSAYFDGRPDETALMLLARAHGAPDFAVAPVGTRDWLAQVRAGLRPVEAGRITVYGSHDRERIAPNRIGLEIEAALAFGTGHHATTRACLIALDRLARSGRTFRRMADIGGGTGVLAMAGCRLWPLRAVAGDIDPVATATARANVAANGLGRRIVCVTAPGFRHPLLQEGPRFDLVAANILAAPLRRLAPEAAGRVAPGGVAILSGLLSRQGRGIEAVWRGWGFRRSGQVTRDGWIALILNRGRARPPLADVRDPC
jgi:ribosomal protein L11 methyltransferase